MLRSKKVIFLSHCILNQNTVVKSLARAKGAYKEVVDLIMNYGIGIGQMPCPEMLFLGMKRPSMTKLDYENANDFRKLCRELAEGVINYIRAYIEAGYKIVGIVGINCSPTCSIGGERGIYMEELFSLLDKENISLSFAEISTSFQEDKDNSEEINRLRRFIEDNL